jgi:putative ABC transport system substrate-binding protein
MAAKSATSTIPIVMLAVGDPVGAGLVASLARPGGNVTGTSGMAVEVTSKSLELLQQVVPKIRLVSVLWNPANAVFQAQMVKATETAARSMGIQLQMLAARDVREIDRAFGAIVQGAGAGAPRAYRPGVRRPALTDRGVRDEAPPPIRERVPGVCRGRRSDDLRP